MNTQESDKIRALCEKYGLDPATACEEDLRDAKMGILCDNLGIDADEMDTDTVDKARAQKRERANLVTLGFNHSDFLYWN